MPLWLSLGSTAKANDVTVEDGIRQAWLTGHPEPASPWWSLSPTVSAHVSPPRFCTRPSLVRVLRTSQNVRSPVKGLVPIKMLSFIAELYVVTGKLLDKVI